MRRLPANITLPVVSPGKARFYAPPNFISIPPQRPSSRWTTASHSKPELSLSCFTSPPRPSSPRRTAFLASRTMSVYHSPCPSLSVLRTTRLPVSASYSFFQQNNPIRAGADVNEAYRISWLQAEIAFFKYNTYICSIWFSTVRNT